ncbi:MAG: NosD domain-containing protein, partial [archaeon]
MARKIKSGFVTALYLTLISVLVISLLVFIAPAAASGNIVYDPETGEELILVSQGQITPEHTIPPVQVQVEPEVEVVEEAQLAPIENLSSKTALKNFYSEAALIEASFVSAPASELLAAESLENLEAISCPPITNGSVINTDVQLCPGTYYISEAIQINTDGITFDCNGATLKGNGSFWASGIDIVSHYGITIKNCIFENYGLASIYAHNLTLSDLNNNTFIGGQSGINLRQGSEVNIIENNKFLNISDFGVLLYNSSHNVVFNNTAEGNSLNYMTGIYEVHSEFNIFSENTIQNCFIGIYSSNTNNTFIAGNNLSQTNFTGIFVINANDTLITNNEVHDNLEDGVSISASNKTLIAFNYIYGNPYGVYVYEDSFDNLFVSNILSSNGLGMHFPSDSDRNDIYNNNFENTGTNALDFSGSNNWNNSTHGNYWNDYDGVDEICDAIGDTPYSIDSDSKDYLPSMIPHCLGWGMSCQSYGCGDGGSSDYGLSFTQYDKFIQMGRSERKVSVVKVKNSGTKDLSEVNVYLMYNPIYCIPPEWYNIKPSIVDLKSGETAEFIVTIKTPDTATSQNYTCIWRAQDSASNALAEKAVDISIHGNSPPITISSGESLYIGGSYVTVVLEPNGDIKLTPEFGTPVTVKSGETVVIGGKEILVEQYNGRIALTLIASYREGITRHVELDQTADKAFEFGSGSVSTDILAPAGYTSGDGVVNFLYSHKEKGYTYINGTEKTWHEEVEITLSGLNASRDMLDTQTADQYDEVFLKVSGSTIKYYY